MKKKQVLAILLSILMVFSMMPSMAFAGAITESNVNNAEDTPSSYGYDETPAEEVTVTVTLSSDGIPLQSYDAEKTATAHMEITVPYFDLALYGLEEYYRYGTENGQGQYTDSTVVERPTMLHMYIYLTERYYLGLSEDQCGKGNDVSGVMDYAESQTVAYFDGNDAYTTDPYGSPMRAFGVSGAPTSLYINGGMWGHDENLKYYRNHRYPLMTSAVGATADYCLLSDGDDLDIAMFSNWDFYTAGQFLAFNKELYNVGAEEGLNVQIYGTSTYGMGGEEETPVAPDDGTFAVTANLYDSNWNVVKNATVNNNGDGTLTVKVPSEAGTYYLMAMDENAGTSMSCFAPATAKIIVTGETEDPSAAALAQAKADAKTELAAYADTNDYRPAQQAELAAAIEAGNTAIDGAETEEAVAAALAQAKAAIDEIKTDAELTAEEAAAALAQAKADAKTELAAYADTNDYRPAQQAELAAAIEAGNTAIDGAETEEAVAKALAQAKAAIDEIKTDAELTAEETAAALALAQAKEDAEAVLDSYSLNDYRLAEKVELLLIVINAKDDIEDAATIEEVETILDVAVATIEALKTDAEWTAEEDAARLEAPVVKASNVAKTGKVVLNWSAVEDADGYAVYRATSKTGTYKKVYLTLDTTFTDTSAKAGKTYYYKVKAICEENPVFTSDDSKVVSRTCDLARPDVNASNAKKGEIKLTWKKVSGAEKYMVYRATSKNGTYKRMTTTTKLSYTNTSAKSGKTYYYKVKAIDADNSAANSAYSLIDKCKCR